MKHNKNKFKKVLLPLVTISLLLSSCANNTYKLDPNYSGATATIRDTSLATSKLKAQIFTVDKINGQRDTTSPHNYVYGGGPQINLKQASRKIPTTETILTISGRDVYGADGVALLDFKKNKSVSGDIYFIPIAGRIYEVRGALSKKSSSVRLIDTTRNVQIGKTITN